MISDVDLLNVLCLWRGYFENRVKIFWYVFILSTRPKTGISWSNSRSCWPAVASWIERLQDANPSLILELSTILPIPSPIICSIRPQWVSGHYIYFYMFCLWFSQHCFLTFPLPETGQKKALKCVRTFFITFSIAAPTKTQFIFHFLQKF